MHFDTKAFSTEAIGRKKQFKNPPKSLSCACAIAKSFCHEKNVHGLISSGSKKALFSAGIKVMVVVVGHGGAVVFTFHNHDHHRAAHCALSGFARKTFALLLLCLLAPLHFDP